MSVSLKWNVDGKYNYFLKLVTQQTHNIFIGYR